MRTVYRVEKPGSEQGLWYTTSGLLRPVVHELGLTCASLPMDHDLEYQRDGIQWYSGCSEMSDLLQWFNPKELLLMKSNGFELLEMQTELVRDYSGHQIFSKQHQVTTQYFDISKLL